MSNPLSSLPSSAAGGSEHAFAHDRLATRVGDDPGMALLRSAALALSDGTEWSRFNDQQVIDQLAAAWADRRWRPTNTAAAPALRRLVVAAATAPAPAPRPPAPSPRPRAAAPATAAPPPETTFGSELDVAAMVAVLVQAAQDGVPFCEECARAAAEAAA